MIYLIHPDIKSYKSFVINSEEARSKLGQETMFHFDPRPKPYSDIWQPLEIEFDSLSSAKKVVMPDITTRNGRLFLNQHAYDALHTVLDAHGEFLPITHKDGDGYLFNVLEDANTNGALDTKLSTCDEYGDVQSVVFHEDKLKGASVVRTAFDNYQGVYCSDRFKILVEGTGLSGVIFSADLGTIYPPDATAGSPAKH
ncbi:hypothetical protein A9Q99_00600 [Gammaproteobacteria bacterium 45_16_T64]|nr:hypothetical protein A9Q99_00600 [Gammaproteobacteria bacterium 45_16_T64]